MYHTFRTYSSLYRHKLVLRLIKIYLDFDMDLSQERGTSGGTPGTGGRGTLPKNPGALSRFVNLCPQKSATRKKKSLS